jgi:hypothetical protein
MTIAEVTYSLDSQSKLIAVRGSLVYKIAVGKITLALTALALVATTTGCSSQAKLRSAYDDTLDFSQYSTYDFYADPGPDESDYQSLFTQYMIVAIDKEMQARGYTLSATPDLLVNFNIQVQDKTTVRTSPSMGMGSGMGGAGYYGYRASYYDPWMGYGYGTETHVSQYTVGTFNIDLVDPKLKRLVWEAVGVGRITEKKLENMREGVREGVPRYFALYPFVAGDGTPQAGK